MSRERGARASAALRRMDSFSSACGFSRARRRRRSGYPGTRRAAESQLLVVVAAAIILAQRWDAADSSSDDRLETANGDPIRDFFPGNPASRENTQARRLRGASILSSAHGTPTHVRPLTLSAHAAKGSSRPRCPRAPLSSRSIRSVRARDLAVPSDKSRRNLGGGGCLFSAVSLLTPPVATRARAPIGGFARADRTIVLPTTAPSRSARSRPSFRDETRRELGAVGPGPTKMEYRHASGFAFPPGRARARALGPPSRVALTPPLPPSIDPQISARRKRSASAPSTPRGSRCVIPGHIYFKRPRLLKPTDRGSNQPRDDGFRRRAPTPD